MIPQPQVMQFDLPGGTMLGKYEILRKLAMGGMAEIYLARSRGTAGFEKLVVIKRILPTVANDPTFVQMFLDEARLAATLQHPNIADVYEVDEHAGSPFFAMEFIHGQDVRAIKRVARERKESVPLAISLAIVHGIASALDYAHDRTGPDGHNMNLVHRDVSSSNILVSYEGAIKLIDFGIARATSRSQQTQVGTLKGKIPYMSPEQCRGQPLDRRSDLWSLGIVMYELTTGRRPFLGENDFAVMDQIVHQGAKPPSSLMRNYPPELEAIVLRLLARKVDERYQTAEELLQDLDPFIAQHRLFVSAKPLSRYMRTVFEDAVAAWDQANEDGVTLAAHIVSTETGKSQLVTPPSSFPAVMPLSQEMPAVRPSELGLRGDPTPLPVATAAQRPTTAAPPPEVAYPDLRKRGGSRLVFALVGVLALGAGGYAGLTLMKGKSETAAASNAVEESDTPNPGAGAPGSTVKMDESAAKQAATAKPDEAADAADATQEADTAQANVPAAGDTDDSAERDGDKPTAEESVRKDPPKTDPPKQDPPRKDPPKKEVKKDPPRKDPPKKEPPKKDPPKKEPLKKDPPKQDPPKKDPPKEKEPKQWDQDSPFLPG